MENNLTFLERLIIGLYSLITPTKTEHLYINFLVLIIIDKNWKQSKNLPIGKGIHGETAVPCL